MGYSNELWDSFDTVYGRTREGKGFCVKVEEFIRKRAEIEREYARKLQSLVKSQEVERGTLAQAWLTVKNETETLAKKHGEIAENISSQVNEPLKTWLKESQKQRKKLKEQALKIIKDLKSAEESCNSAKKSFETARRAQDKAREEYEKATFNNAQSPAVEKLAKKASADTKKAEQADLKYQEAVKALQEAQTRFYSTELPITLDELEKMEEGRSYLLKQAFENLAAIQKSLAPEVEALADRIKNNAAAISSKNDIGEFIREKKTGAVKPPFVEYEPYDSAIQACKPAALGSSKSPTASSASNNGRATFDPLKRSTNSTPTVTPVTVTRKEESTAGVTVKPGEKIEPKAVVVVSNNNSNNNTSATPAVLPLGIAKALFDYAATEDQELSFKTGDMITILQKDPSGWWQGELHGKIGVFPSVDWVEELPYTPPTAATNSSTTATSPPTSTSTSSREATSGASTTVTTANNVALPTKSAAPAKKEKCKALYAYAAENEFEVNMNEGDVMTIDHLDDDGWYSGWNPKGEFGRFPSNYTEPFE